jgi:predicted alpha/beta hydrolase family esterase
MKPRNVLILPGWENSGPKHWQSLWEQRHGYRRVEQHDWMKPLRGDWVARLEDVVLTCDEPAVLVAHSLGCILTAAWAAKSQNTHRVKAALLVAPGDVERPEIRDQIPSWSPIELQALPFRQCCWAAATTRTANSSAPACSHTHGTRSSWTTATADTSTPIPDWPAGPKAMSCCRT